MINKLKYKAPLLLFFILTLLVSCDKGNSPLPVIPNPNPALCILKGETTALIGNYTSWQYEYSDDGLPSKVTRYGSTGDAVSVMDILYDHTDSKVPNSLSRRVVQYNTNLFLNILPTVAQITTTTSDGITLTNYLQYSFFYDASLRLIKVSEQTPAVGDWEWDLYITYNDKNNVTSLQYQWTTGPSTIIKPITVAGYDDNPTPYSSVPFWKFFSNNFAWDNSDPEPIITALSANNPLSYTLDNGADIWVRTMVYSYNEHGYPVVRTNTNKTDSGEATFTQTYSYECK